VRGRKHDDSVISDCIAEVVSSPVVAGGVAPGSNEIGLLESCGRERKRTWYPSGYSFESTTTSATSRSAACRTSPRTVNAELVTRNERSLDGDRPPTTTAADVIRRRIGVVVDDDDNDRLCGRTVRVEEHDDEDDSVDSDVDVDGDETADEAGTTLPTEPEPNGFGATTLTLGDSGEVVVVVVVVEAAAPGTTGSAGTVRSMTPR
jgi:hypothetical protein